MVLALTTLPDAKSAKKLARALIEDQLAACVSVIPGVSSTYRWKGKIEQASETLLLIKTAKAKQKALQKFVLSRHPYELPEWIVLPVTAGSKRYIDWVRHHCRWGF